MHLIRAGVGRDGISKVTAYLSQPMKPKPIEIFSERLKTTIRSLISSCFKRRETR